MIYITIPANRIIEANTFVKTIDPTAVDSFVVNQVDELGNEFCLISLPDNGSEYNKKMVEHFSKSDEDPREVEVMVGKTEVVLSDVDM